MRVAHRTTLGGLATVVCLAWAASAWAVVETIDATVTAEVQEFIGSEIVNSDAAFESLDETTGNLPLIVQAGFDQFNEVEDSIAAVRARAVFSDPRLSVTLNPKEFALEAAAFSVDPGIFHTGRAESTETREITFLSEEIGNNPDGTPVQAISQFFLDGLMAVWGDFVELESGGTVAVVNLNVVQTPSGEASPTTVLEAAITLTHNPDGTPSLSVTGALTADNVILIDASSVLPELGEVFFVLIPEIGIPYVYDAVVGEPFQLDARIEVSVENEPDTGAGVALGLEFDQIQSAIEEQIGEPLVLPLLDILQVAADSPLIAAKPLPRSARTEVQVVDRSLPGLGDLAWPGCGAMGVEALLLAGLLPLALAAGRRRW